MTSVDVTQNLRPLKLAYIVRPNDTDSLEKIVATNAFLWGGRYNCILPLYKKRPAYFGDIRRIEKVRDVLAGNLMFFDPDFIVLSGDIKGGELKDPPCGVIKLSDIYENIAREGMPGYGIGWLDIATDYYDRDFKFIRRDKRAHYYPTFAGTKAAKRVLKSIFGCFPDELPSDAVTAWTKHLEAQEREITLDNYLSFLDKGGPTNIHRLTSYDLKIDYTRDVPRERYVVFLMDDAAFIDIIDYANLRAAGYTILPILRSSLESENAKMLVLEFVEDHAWVHPDNPHAKRPVTLQKSRSLTKKEIESFYRFVDPPNFQDDDWPKCLMRLDLPDFWSRWDQEQGHVSCAALTAGKKEIETSAEERRIRSRPLAPDFLSDRFPRTYKPQFANDVAVSVYRSGSKSYEAGVYPSNSEEVVRAAGLFGIDKWLIKKSGITQLCKTDSDLMIFDVQTADMIFLSWLKSQGWDARISDAGTVAYQMLRQIDGPWGITFLKGKKLVRFLVGKDEDEASGDRPQRASGISEQDFMRNAKQAYNDHHVLWGEDKFIKVFFEHNIFKLGTTLKCDVCARRSWHPVDALKYSILCPHCLNEFEIPSHRPQDIKWSYKTIGPFSVSGKAAGAYCVLLTADFFNEDRTLSSGTTTILSFEAEKDDIRLEADVALFYREGSYFNRTTELIFCECKTYKAFTEKDIGKMRVLAKQFPGAMLVFATLNDSLTEKEKKLLAPFINACNRYHERDRPRNPVMILTANELFAHFKPPFDWENMGKKYKDHTHISSQLDLCQATQKIYLGMDSWRKDWEKKWEKKAATPRRAVV